MAHSVENDAPACAWATCFSVEKLAEDKPWELVAQCDGTGSEDCGFRLVIEALGHVSDVVFTSDDVKKWNAEHQAHTRHIPPGKES